MYENGGRGDFSPGHGRAYGRGFEEAPCDAAALTLPGSTNQTRRFWQESGNPVDPALPAARTAELLGVAERDQRLTEKDGEAGPLSAPASDAWLPWQRRISGLRGNG